MRTIYILIILLFTNIMTGNLYAENGNKKILIAYYSWSEGKNTETLANYIQEKTNGEIFKIEEVNPYPSDYNECIKVAKSDIEKGLKPAIKGSIDDIDKYDIIFIGTPNWWSTMAPPVLTFLSSYNLSGKTIIPFCTHGGGGKARCFSDMEPLQPKATFKKGLAISGHKPQADIDKAIRNSKTVDTWLKDCNVIK